MLDAAEHLPDERTGRYTSGPCRQFTDHQFQQWTTMLREKTGLFIAPERKSFLDSGLRKRMRETGCCSTEDYYLRLLEGSLPADEWTMLIDTLTVHETCFFRHQSSMELVEKQLLPGVYERRGNMQVLSVGCASGEETYSLAMLLDEHISGRKGLSYSLTGVDISLPALQLARQGLYLKRRLKGIPENFREKYCHYSSGSRFQVSQQLRSRVEFRRISLLEDSPPAYFDLDLVFCQNLLIYYDHTQRRAIAGTLAGLLRPGGVLVVGPGELTNWCHRHMERVCCDDTLAYRRTN